MNKFYKILQNYLIYAFPAVLIIMVWGSFQAQDEVKNVVLHGVWSVFGWNIMLWFLALLIYLFSLVLLPDLREKTLTRLAKIRERDEREEYITGRAARTAYISTMAFLVLMLFLSMFTFSVQKFDTPQGPEKHTGTMSLGINFEFLDKHKKEVKKDGLIFENSDLPISKPAIILSILLWQVLSFTIPARRQSRELA